MIQIIVNEENCFNMQLNEYIYKFPIQKSNLKLTTHFYVILNNRLEFFIAKIKLITFPCFVHHPKCNRRNVLPKTSSFDLTKTYNFGTIPY